MRRKGRRRLHLFHPVFVQPREHSLIPIRPVGKAAVHAGDRGGGSACLFRDGGVCFAPAQQRCDFHALRKRVQLRDRAEILKKAVAFLHALKGKDSLEKMIRFLALQLALIHVFAPLLSHNISLAR